SRFRAASAWPSAPSGSGTMTRPATFLVFSALVWAAGTGMAHAQEPATREALIEQEQEAKAAALKPAEPGKAEQYVNRLSDSFLAGMALHPFFESSYTGGGFTLGAGYLK